MEKTFPDLLIGAMGPITEPKEAESYLREGKADVIFMVRAPLRNPHWPLQAARELGVKIKPSDQYERAWDNAAFDPLGK